MKNIVNLLKGKDLRSIGNANKIVNDIEKNPDLFKEIFNGIKNEDPVIRMRAADAVEKITKKHKEFLIPYKNEIIENISEIEQQEVRWHIALIFSYLDLNENEKEIVIQKLYSWIKDSDSVIVKVNSLQALFDITKNDLKYKNKVKILLEENLNNKSSAIKARCKKLLSQLKK